MSDSREFDPLDYANLTRHCVEELMRREPVALPIPTRFAGSGVYALFYLGNLELYSRIRSPKCRVPIYVGKAVPAGARKGSGSRKPRASEPALWKRLTEHHASLSAAENLAPEDFRCRYMCVKPLWISMTERFLIEAYRPLWNVVIDGFGNHAPGSGREMGKLTWWDALHPGRSWAHKLLQVRTKAEAEARVTQYLARYELKATPVDFGLVAEAGEDRQSGDE